MGPRSRTLHLSRASALVFTLWAAAVQADEPPNVAGAAGDASADSSNGEPPAAAAGAIPPQVTAPQLTPPKGVQTDVTYPLRAHGDASVILELVIAADGTVQSARALEGASPFAEAAVQSAQKWVFTPARQGDRVLPAKIRFEVRYFEEQADADAAAPPEPEPNVTEHQNETTPTPSVEVVVRGKLAPGAVSLTRAEARELPGSFGDPTRAIEAMPGVTPVVSGVPLFFIRGAPPGNVGFFIDGIKVPLLYHAFLGPAVLQPAMIQSVNLYPGGYPAQYGRVAGAVVDLGLAPVQDDLHAEATLRLYDAGAFVSSPFAGGRGRAMVGGRYSYTGLLLSLFTPAKLDYWDYNTLAAYDLTRKDTLSVFAFGSHEYFDDGKDNFFGTEFHRIDLRYDRKLSHQANARVAMTFGKDRTRATNGELSSESFGVRSELRDRFSNAVLLRAGADVMLEGFSMNVDALNTHADDIERLFPARTDWVTGAYTDVVWSPEEWVEVTPGLRADLYESQGSSAVGVDPRLAARYHVTKKIDVVHSFGVAHQIPSYVPEVPGAVVAGLPGGLQTALQSSAAVEITLPDDFWASIGVFQNVYLHLTDPISLSQNLALNSDVAEQRATGSARGLEFQLKRSLSRRVGGLLSYTLSRSTRSYGTIHSISGFDRPHVVSVAVSVDLGDHWKAGAKGIFYSGVPGSRTTGEGPIFDQGRAPPFFRVDLRLEKRFRLGDRGSIAPFVEVMNATMSREIIRRRCGQTNCPETHVGPIFLPSLGVEASY
ncbi:MAG TPA: energy transducer TonB [Polyangiaceae bacterium]|nr:energy transducer TonB [Polyangiaceae bacterium]